MWTVRLNCDWYPSMHASARGQQYTGIAISAHFPPTMSNTPPPPTNYWTTADRAFFIDRVKAGCINIDGTTYPAIDAIRNKCWAHKSLRSFRTNFRKVASDLQVERQVHGGRGTRMSSVCLLHDHTPLSLIFPLS